MGLWEPDIAAVVINYSPMVVFGYGGMDFLLTSELYFLDDILDGMDIGYCEEIR